MAVVKVGGSVLRSPEDYVTAAEEIMDGFIDNGVKPIVVVSAMKSVTDDLFMAVDGDYDAGVRVIDRYLDAAMNLGVPYSEIVEYLNIVSEGISHTPISRWEKEYIISMGETLSKILMGYVLNSLGAEAVLFDARKIVKAAYSGRDVSIDYRSTRETVGLLKQEIRDGRVPVIEGYIAGLNDDRTVTLGRGGSDYTAASLAVLIRADKVYFATDVPGIYSADPSIVDNPVIVRSMSFEEGLIASRHGAKRIHPKTFEALADTEITALVGFWNEFNTKLERKANGIGKVKLVAAESNGSKGSIALVGGGVCNYKTFSHINRILCGSREYNPSIRSLCPKPGVLIEASGDRILELVKLLHDQLVLGD
ncbi:MAG: hypothetical protein GSR79_00290 [Desulfurococcales archaeon]|nr:hypothetical protein [Desulfurococcales archaeon]